MNKHLYDLITKLVEETIAVRIERHTDPKPHHHIEIAVGTDIEEKITEHIVGVGMGKDAMDQAEHLSKYVTTLCKAVGKMAEVKYSDFLTDLIAKEVLETLKGTSGADSKAQAQPQPQGERKKGH